MKSRSTCSTCSTLNAKIGLTPSRGNGDSNEPSTINEDDNKEFKCRTTRILPW